MRLYKITETFARAARFKMRFNFLRIIRTLVGETNGRTGIVVY